MKCKYINDKNKQCNNKSISSKIYFCKRHFNKLMNGGALDDFRPSVEMLQPSELPLPETHHSYYSSQAPAYQLFGNYVCIKKSFLTNIRNLLLNIANME